MSTTSADRTPRVVTYTRVACCTDRAKLARRERHLAMAVASRRAGSLVGAYADAGPTPPTGRPGLTRLIVDAAAGRFDLVVVEQLDRLAPRPDDAAQIVAVLRALGVVVHPLGGGHRRLIAAGTAAAIVKLLGA